VNFNTVGTTAMLKLAVAVAGSLAESVTFTTKVEVPDTVGVPEITPALDNVNPVGKLPDARLHV
jgi:hypothetical protein